MSRLKFVGTRIPPEWVEHLEEITKKTGITQGEALRKAIGQYLGLDADNPDNKKTDPLRSEIEALKARVTALEGKTPLSERYPVSQPTKVRELSIGAVEESVSAYGICNHLLVLTTGELFMALEGKGYARSIGTLRRALKAAIDVGKLPDDLSALGVRADFETRRSANPKDNSVRWLSLHSP